MDSNNNREKLIPMERLSTPAQRALYASGYIRLDQLTKVSARELLQLHGLGPKTISILKEVLDREGMAFKE